MSRFFKGFSALILVLAIHGCGNSDSSVIQLNLPGNTEKKAEARVPQEIVLMISIDGFRNDYLQKFSPPNLTKLAKKGVVAKGLIPAFPTLTFPNHVTLVTGRAPGNHGIVSNFFFDNQRKQAYQMNDGLAVNDGTWYRGEPVWAVAEKSGLKAATFFWVGSEADIGGIRPTYVKHYEDALPNAQRAKEVIDWLHLPDDQRPGLVTLYFSTVDSAGHKFGPDSEEVRAAVLEVDANIGLIADDAEKNGIPVQFVIVSDHGMLAVKDMINLTAIADLSKFDGFERGALTTLHAKTPDAIPEAYAKLKAAERNYKVYRPQDLPPRWKFTDTARSGDLIVVADPGYYLYQQGFTTEVPKVSKATHGWDPSTPEMQGLFIVQGSKFKSGLVIPAFDNVNVYPLVLEVLKLKATLPHDGDLKVLQGVLK
ncbi:MAG: ectonucleotide pyrophosphatase/phosphodiesterase [Bdellovibrionota bacterium]